MYYVTPLVHTALLVGALQAMAGLAGTLERGSVRIVLHETYAVVVLDYRIERFGERLVFDAARQRGQLVVVEEAIGPGGPLELEQRAEMRRLAAASGGLGRGDYRIRYTVEGEGARIPIFVPNAATPPGRGAIELVLLGATEDIDGSDAFPRLRRGDDGSLEAIVSNVPSTVVLARRGAFPIIRVSEWIVMLLVVAGTVFWALRTARMRRQGPQSAPAEDR